MAGAGGSGGGTAAPEELLVWGRPAAPRSAPLVSFRYAVLAINILLLCKINKDLQIPRHQVLDPLLINGENGMMSSELRSVAGLADLQNICYATILRRSAYVLNFKQWVPRYLLKPLLVSAKNVSAPKSDKWTPSSLNSSGAPYAMSGCEIAKSLIIPMNLDTSLFAYLLPLSAREGFTTSYRTLCCSMSDHTIFTPGRSSKICHMSLLALTVNASPLYVSKSLSPRRTTIISGVHSQAPMVYRRGISWSHNMPIFPCQLRNVSLLRPSCEPPANLEACLCIQ
ncbi:hypothetical protein UY3_05922 [Chelonia mydas]|uniref:Uncharacterized protein n=1 Tax=Chelonia mydas TaxID=8469 RepID=M7BI38_CHEMY|nr:hypothetical protein UY3_05922 [Chelonia mydas]